MRPYRGFTKEGREVKGWYCKWHQGHYIFDPEHSVHFLACFIKILPKTVGQFTGLKDKNGKEAYAGDKIQTLVNGRWCIDIIHRTKYGWYPWVCDDDYAGKEFEIIGYENPELIEESQE